MPWYLRCVCPIRNDFKRFEIEYALQLGNGGKWRNSNKKPPGITRAAVFEWSCGELNPGPVTAPSVFYVRSLLAFVAICLPPPVSQTTGGGHSRRKKSPNRPVAQQFRQVFLMTLSIPPKAKGSERSSCSLVNPGAKLRQRERTQCG